MGPEVGGWSGRNSLSVAAGNGGLSEIQPVATLSLTGLVDLYGLTKELNQHHEEPLGVVFIPKPREASYYAAKALRHLKLTSLFVY